VNLNLGFLLELVGSVASGQAEVDVAPTVAAL
jgi:hypothetical protein